MKNRSTQRGMTMWGLMFVLGVLAFFLFLGFKLFPVYMDDFKVKGALDSLSRQQEFPSMGKQEIADALAKRFDIDNITHVNLGTDLTVETRGRMKVVRIYTEAEIPMLFNISALVKFDHVKEVRGGE